MDSCRENNSRTSQNIEMMGGKKGPKGVLLSCLTMNDTPTAKIYREIT